MFVFVVLKSIKALLSSEENGAFIDQTRLESGGVCFPI